MYHDKLGLEALFKVPGYYIHVQYLSDDPEYCFDYTIYDDDFNDIDGGVIGTDDSWDLRRAAEEVVSEAQYYSGLDIEGTPHLLNIEEYEDKLY